MVELMRFRHRQGLANITVIVTDTLLIIERTLLISTKVDTIQRYAITDVRDRAPWGGLSSTRNVDIRTSDGRAFSLFDLDHKVADNLVSVLQG